jgi:hypothetical protein
MRAYNYEIDNWQKMIILLCFSKIVEDNYFVIPSLRKLAHGLY